MGAVGIVIARASPCPKPTEFGSVGGYWSNEGWLARAYMSQSRASGTARLRLSPSVIVLSPA